MRRGRKRSALGCLERLNAATEAGGCVDFLFMGAFTWPREAWGSVPWYLAVLMCFIVSVGMPAPLAAQDYLDGLESAARNITSVSEELEKDAAGSPMAALYFKECMFKDVEGACNELIRRDNADTKISNWTRGSAHRKRGELKEMRRDKCGALTDYRAALTYHAFPKLDESVERLTQETLGGCPQEPLAAVRISRSQSEGEPEIVEPERSGSDDAGYWVTTIQLPPLVRDASKVAAPARKERPYIVAVAQSPEPKPVEEPKGDISTGNVLPAEAPSQIAEASASQHPVVSENEGSPAGSAVSATVTTGETLDFPEEPISTAALPSAAVVADAPRIKPAEPCPGQPDPSSGSEGSPCGENANSTGAIERVVARTSAQSNAVESRSRRRASLIAMTIIVGALGLMLYLRRAVPAWQGVPQGESVPTVKEPSLDLYPSRPSGRNSATKDAEPPLVDFSDALSEFRRAVKLEDQESISDLPSTPDLDAVSVGPPPIPEASSADLAVEEVVRQEPQHASLPPTNEPWIQGPVAEITANEPEEVPPPQDSKITETHPAKAPEPAMRLGELSKDTRLSTLIAEGSLDSIERGVATIFAIDGDGHLSRQIGKNCRAAQGAAVPECLLMIEPGQREAGGLLNLFAVDITDPDPLVRNKRFNSIFELHTLVFEALLGRQFTQDNRLALRHFTRLLHALPGANLKTWLDLLAPDALVRLSDYAGLTGHPETRRYFNGAVRDGAFLAFAAELERKLRAQLADADFAHLTSSVSVGASFDSIVRKGRLIVFTADLSKLGASACTALLRIYLGLIAASKPTRYGEAGLTLPICLFLDHAERLFGPSAEEFDFLLKAVAANGVSVFRG